MSRRLVAPIAFTMPYSASAFSHCIVRGKSDDQRAGEERDCDHEFERRPVHRVQSRAQSSAGRAVNQRVEPLSVQLRPDCRPACPCRRVSRLRRFVPSS